jgi:hypothetical protein
MSVFEKLWYQGRAYVFIVAGRIRTITKRTITKAGAAGSNRVQTSQKIRNEESREIVQPPTLPAVRCFQPIRATGEMGPELLEGF